MPKNIKMLKIDVICRKIVDLTGLNCNHVAGMMMRTDNNTIQEFHGIINNFADQITVLKRKLKTEQEKNKF